MAQESFTMETQKRGRMKYLLLTIAPAIGLMYLFAFLKNLGILPGGSEWALIYQIISMSFMGVLGYFLIFCKNHKITIENNILSEINWQQKETCRFSVTRIHSVRRNFLNEIILLDQNGKKLLCVESNMSNFEQFQQWLGKHIE